ncbi:MAG: sigma-70 family RNA polymerase sigma factor [Saprospiraceae bacterium]|nr:sigma-70 family RNA polymerase sigma factor [Saprospiraceae bacterium]
MQKKTYTDQQILSMLKADLPMQQDRALRAMYRQHFEVVQSFVHKNQGNDQDAEDIFQDGLVVIYNNIREDDFLLQSSLKTYVYSICRNIWLNRLRKLSREVEVTDEHENIEIPDDQMKAIVKGERSEIIVQLIQKMGTECRQILQFFYFERLRMKRISELMGISSEQVAKNKKSRCMKKLRTMAEEDTVFKDFFSR